MGYLLFDAQPPSRMPYTPSEEIASRKTMPTLTFAIQGVTVYPNTWNVPPPEMGITARAVKAGITVRMGARVKRKRSARSGMMSSLIRSLIPSAIGWRIPWNPTRRGASRTCMKPRIFLSRSVR